LTLHRDALALVDDAQLAGAPLELYSGGISPRVELPDALDARLKALCCEGDTRAGVASNRALRAVLRAPDRACRELLTLPVALAKLAVPYAATFTRKGVCAVFATSESLYNAACQRGDPTFVLRELDAAARAYDAGRAGPAQLDAWLAAKRRGSWLLTSEIADAPAAPPGLTPDPPRCTFGELFDGLGAEITAVELQGVT
jgi:hypothetical protein